MKHIIEHRHKVLHRDALFCVKYYIFLLTAIILIRPVIAVMNIIADSTYRNCLWCVIILVMDSMDMLSLWTFEPQ